MIKAVIFDLYGTLLEISEDSQPFFELTRHLKQRAREAFHTALTTDNVNLVDFAKRLEIEAPANMGDIQKKLNQKVRSVRLFDDTIATLKEVKSRGLKTAVVSNLATPYKQPYFDHGLEGLIDVLVFSCDCGYAKPQGEIYQLALEQLDLPADQTIMIGDSFKCDVEGPETIGIKSLHLVRDNVHTNAVRAGSDLSIVFDYLN